MLTVLQPLRIVRKQMIRQVVFHHLARDVSAYSMNRFGSFTDLCGTPYFSCETADSLPPVRMICVRLVKKSASQSTISDDRRCQKRPLSRATSERRHDPDPWSSTYADDRQTSSSSGMVGRLTGRQEVDCVSLSGLSVWRRRLFLRSLTRSSDLR